MFDRIMENSMAMWMLVSALFPIFFFGTIIKAVLHFRRMRALKRLMGLKGLNGLKGRGNDMENLTAPEMRDDRMQTEDWVPSR